MKTIVPKVKYNKAVELFESGEYEASEELFSKIYNYKESRKYLDDPRIIQLHNKGEVIYFGGYQWYIIERTDNHLKLLCKDVINSMQYHYVWNEITWEQCYLRTWLNEGFYNSFSEEEKKYICKTKCTTLDSNDTEDYVFLLSSNEAESVDKSILAVGTDWWLRSMGRDREKAAIVNNDIISYIGDTTVSKNGVRPALVLDLSKFEE